MTDEKLEFKRLTGGYTAENHNRYYAVFSDWGYREDRKAESFIWVLEVREKSEVLGRRTIVGLPPIYTAKRRTMREAMAEAQRFEDSVHEALRNRD